MFQNIADAQKRLEGAGFSTSEIAIIIPLLRPCISFERSVKPRMGETRLGGVPDLPPDITWPIRAVPDNVDEICDFGGPNHSDDIRKHISQPLPYQFVAQIDLAEASSLSPEAELLPDKGRLLIFCDLITIPWRDGIESCKILWDQTPVTALSPSVIPPILQVLAEEYETEAKAAIANFDGKAVSDSLKKARDDFPPELRAFFDNDELNAVLDKGLDISSHSDNDVTSSYWGINQSMTLVKHYSLPEYRVPEASVYIAFQALMKDDEACDRYSDFFSEIHHDQASGLQRQQMLGHPIPEQDDPRFAAVAHIDYGCPKGWTSDNRPDDSAIEEKMRRWHLLFQLDQSDYYQDMGYEGMVYFLIRDDHLHARNFDQVFSVYQQT